MVENCVKRNAYRLVKNLNQAHAKISIKTSLSPRNNKMFLLGSKILLRLKELLT